MPKSRRAYFDYAASTPVAPEVFRAMRPYFSERFGNPGSLHSFGQEAMAAVDRARETVANALGADFREVVFTGSATEANNLALRGAGVSRVVVSAIEHESVLQAARDLAGDGVEVVELPVNADGAVRPDKLAKALASGPALVSVMYANNETGTIQPIQEISKLVHASGSMLHVDAAQAFQFLDCGAGSSGADLLTISGHKIYGPKGIGALYIRKGTKVRPISSGGGQEFGLRSGTENTALIAGLAEAVGYVGRDKDRHALRLADMRADLFRGMKGIFPKARINGGRNSLPHILNVWLPGVSAEDMLIRLDMAGVAVSAGSACASRSSRPSHVLLAMGFSEKRARESLRISLGRPSSPKEISFLLKAMRSARR